jgi:DNA repair photolyase
MEYKLINCDSVVKKITRKDALFHGNYCLDPYQNCEFGCLYCDSSFEKIIYAKGNVVDVLKREIAQIDHGWIIIGSVNDPYQNAEKTYQLTKSILETLAQYTFPCHILTKSPLILRDIDLLLQLQCMVTVSFTSLDDRVLRVFEPGAPSPKDRLKAVEKLRDNGIHTGVAMIPMIPYIIEDEIEKIVQAANDVHAQYLLHKHLELKGDQEVLFKNMLETHYPHLLPKYDVLYKDDFNPRKQYVQELNKMLELYCNKYKIPDKITV